MQQGMGKIGTRELSKEITGELSGFSHASFDLSCHADGTF
jgi:hypothetical protein